MKRRSLIILGAVVLVGVLAFVSAFFIAGGGWLPQRDMMSLYDSVQAMRQEYDHVAEIRTITYLWPEGKILVSARSPEDATHVALNVVPIIYDGWPVVVTYSVIIQPADFRTASCTGPTGQ
ncbi:MAG: hypothetical protein IBX67_08195 [Dehalococcoidia bacterium]|nr:hypothetical protein [Dehalococcoidia bacterium]